MKMKLSTLLLIAATPAFLAACDAPSVLKKAEYPDHSYVAEPSRSQMYQEATGRSRERDLRQEVTGNIAFLQSHLGFDRSHILDMRDSLLVSIPGRGMFEDQSSQLSASGIDAIARVAGSMIEFPHTRVTVVGHVKGTTSDQSDQILSERRAVAVKSVMMSHGIDECRIGVMGKGSDDHVAAPVTERRNQYNDRIEILMKPFQDGACV